MLGRLREAVFGGGAGAMSGPTVETVREALRKIVDPADGRDIVAAGMVEGVRVADGAVTLAIAVDPARAARMEPLRAAAEAAVLAAPGVEKATVVLTAHSGAPPSVSPSAPAGAAAGAAPGARQNTPPPDLGRRRAGAGDRPLKPPPTTGGPIPGVASLIAIASGKGGVGKSTVAANLAVALARKGRRVGLLDADVYGPSQPRMLGLSGAPTSPDGQTINPLHGHGVTVMSMGFMVGEGQSVVWRGPMLMSALTQMLRQVAWGELDHLIVDLPPGTGDVQLTLVQRAELTGAVIVSTPQDVALIDARKAIDMFAKTKTPILGIIENMSSFACPHCGEESHIFGHGGARREAEALGLPFLGEIPIDLDTRILSDEGTPIVAARPQSAQAKRFHQIADRLVDRVAAAQAPG